MYPQLCAVFSQVYDGAGSLSGNCDILLAGGDAFHSHVAAPPGQLAEVIPSQDCKKAGVGGGHTDRGKGEEHVIHHEGAYLGVPVFMNDINARYYGKLFLFLMAVEAGEHSFLIKKAAIPFLRY